MRDDTAGAGRQDRPAVAADPERGVEIDAVRAHRERCQHLVQQHRMVAEEGSAAPVIGTHAHRASPWLERAAATVFDDPEVADPWIRGLCDQPSEEYPSDPDH